MELTKAQYKRLKELMSITMKLAEGLNYKFMCTMLYIIENSCKWKVDQKNMESGTQFI